MSLQSSFILKDLPGTTRVSVAEVNFCDNCPAWGFLGRIHSVDTDPRATACGSTRSKESFCLSQISRCCQESCSLPPFTHCEFLKGLRFMHGRQLQLLLLQIWPSVARGGTQLLPSHAGARCWSGSQQTLLSAPAFLPQPFYPSPATALSHWFVVPSVFLTPETSRYSFRRTKVGFYLEFLSILSIFKIPSLPLPE